MLTKISAELAGTASAMATLGCSPEQTYQRLLEKGASYEEAQFLVKEAFLPGLLARGASFLGSKVLPRAASWMGQHGAQAGAQMAKGLPASPVGRMAGWGANKLRGMAGGLRSAGQALQNDSWGAMGSGLKNFAHGALLAGGKGPAATIGKGILAGTTASALLGH